MNPLTNVKNIIKLNERELSLGVKVSWHDQYKDSAWIFIGGLPYDLTEGDVISVFSQYGEIANINLIRDKKTGKSKGFGFICFENQKSTVLCVDNLNGIKILGRTIRVDHVANYRPPKEHENEDDITRMLRLEGCAPRPNAEEAFAEAIAKDNKKKRDDDDEARVKVKPEKHDPGYDKYLSHRSGGNQEDGRIEDRMHFDESKQKRKGEKESARESRTSHSYERKSRDEEDRVVSGGERIKRHRESKSLRPDHAKRTKERSGESARNLDRDNRSSRDYRKSDGHSSRSKY